MAEETVSGNLNMDSFNPKKAELIVTAEKFKPILAIEIVDKKTYDQVHEAQMSLGETRRQIEETGEAMRKDAVAFQKKVIVVQKDLINTLAIKQGEEFILMEDILKAKKKEYNDAIEKKKEEDRKAQEELANNRNQELAKYGYVHDLFDLKIMEEDKFQELLAEKKIQWEESEKIRIENERVEAEKKEALEKQRIEQEAKEKEFKAREDAIKAKEDEQKRIDDAKKRQQELDDAKKQAEKDTEDRIKKEQADKEYYENALTIQKVEEARQEEIKMAKLKKYREFCESIGYKKEEDYLWVTNDTSEGREFYKKVGTYLK